MKKLRKGISALVLSAALVSFSACSLAFLGGKKDSVESKAESSSAGATASENITSESSEAVTSSGAQESVTSESSEEEVWVNHGDLVEYFYNTQGKAALKANMDMEIITDYSTMDVEIGAPGVEEISIDGRGYYTLTVTGSGGGVIRTPEDGVLVFKNLNIKNESGSFDDQETGFRGGYADFGGKIRFENCKITASIQIHGEADVEFIDCAFVSELSDMYAIWMTQGKAKFTNCTFTGYRAIKLYEGSDHYSVLLPAYDVESLIVENCTFTDISKKPGLAIDLMADGETTIVIKDSTFNGCQNFKAGVAEGIDGVYESRLYTDGVNLTLENITVDGVFYETLSPDRAG